MFSPQEELEIKGRLEEVVNEVKLILFANPARRIVLISGDGSDEVSEETEKIIRALVALAPDKLKLEVYDPKSHPELLQQYRVTEIPTLVIEGDRDYGIRFLGTPNGYEFASLLEDLIGVGSRDSGLSEESRTLVQSLTEPLDLKVFVTPG